MDAGVVSSGERPPGANAVERKRQRPRVRSVQKGGGGLARVGAGPGRDDGRDGQQGSQAWESPWLRARLQPTKLVKPRDSAGAYFSHGNQRDPPGAYAVTYSVLISMVPGAGIHDGGWTTATGPLPVGCCTGWVPPGVPIAIVPAPGAPPAELDPGASR